MEIERLTGELEDNVMFDAVCFYKDVAQPTEAVSEVLQQYGPEGFVLATVHRAENTDSPDALRRIFTALQEIHHRIPVVIPLHPRTRKAVLNYGLPLEVHDIEPVGYFGMLSLLEQCRLVMTDSGGVQKEAFFFRKPCVTLRDRTEWVELVGVGANTLAGSSTAEIVAAFESAFSKIPVWELGIFGDGHAGERIVDLLRSAFDGTPSTRP